MKTIHVIRSKRVVTPDGVAAATVHIRNGKIAAVRGHDDLPCGANVYDAGNSVVMPGLVDTHVHINEPGRTDWEGFTTATLRGCGWRRYYADRHAAEQYSRDDHGGGA